MNKMNFNWENYRTDKNMTGHGYNCAYDYFLSSQRKNIENVIEIGSRLGSIQLWLDYFDKCKLFGIDIIDPSFKSDRFIYENINQGNDLQWKSFIEKYKLEFDVIIDDGPHTTPEQLISFNVLFPILKSNGIYIIEDLHSTEPYDKNYISNRKECNYSILDILKDFKKLTFNKNKYLYNLDYLKNEISDIVIVESDRNRWPNIMSKPSEIAFIFKK